MMVDAIGPVIRECEKPMFGISVAYIGPHQAFQLALAAHEIGCLNHFYLSFFDGSWTWGALVSWLGGADRMISRRAPAIPSRLVRENPWPLTKHRVFQKIQPSNHRWFRSNQEFDEWVARQLSTDTSRIFIGTETCALRSFEAALHRQMIMILDCPGLEIGFRDDLARKAADDLRLPKPVPSDTSEILAWKERERTLADYILVYSGIHRDSFLRVGVPPHKIIEIPLWADPEIWYPPPIGTAPSRLPLKVLYAGQITLRKGVPYLLKAARECSSAVELTLVGTVAKEMKPLLETYKNDHRLLGHQSKTALRELYWESDVLVLPSLGDSWGFVALEAMLCGLPVIITENCGVPVPDGSWRVPVLDSAAIAERLLLYSTNRGLCRRDGEVAAAFAKQFTPLRYRIETQRLFAKVLDQSPS
jgi:glycosyltransferase involved in cell wall biosynthesis